MATLFPEFEDDKAGYPRYLPEKTCLKCGETKSITEFARRSGGKSNYRNVCKRCQVTRQNKWRQTPVQRAKGRERMRKLRAIPEIKQKEAKRRRALNLKSPLHVFKMAIFNAAKRHLVSVTAEQLMSMWKRQNGCCTLTGIKMTWGQGKIEPTSISVDRIDQDQEYAIENVRLVCHAVNAFRGRMTDAEMLAMAHAIIAHMEVATELKPFPFVA